MVALDEVSEVPLGADDILIVGINFGQDEAGNVLSGPEVDIAHNEVTGATVRWEVFDKLRKTSVTFPSGTELQSYHIKDLGRVVDAFDATETRIVFGVAVSSIQEGRGKLPEVRNWFLNLGVTLPLDIWRWNPYHRPSFEVSRAA